MIVEKYKNYSNYTFTTGTEGRHDAVRSVMSISCSRLENFTTTFTSIFLLSRVGMSVASPN